MRKRKTSPVRLRDDKRARTLVTPEGLTLPITLAARGARAGALIIDVMIILFGIIAVELLLVWLAAGVLDGTSLDPDQLDKGAVEFLGILLALFVFAVPLRAEPNHIVATLVSESATVAPGGTVTLAIAMQPGHGWHGYWTNPGEAGFEPRFAWQGDVRAGKPMFPVPQTLVVGGLMNYVFEGPHALLVPVSVAATATPGIRLPVALNLDYLACTDKICVPQRAELALTLTVGPEAVDAASRARFDAWRAKLPMPLGAPATFERQGGKLRLAIPFPAGATLGTAHFFPSAGGLIVDAGAQTFARDGDLLVAELPAAAGAAPVAGVLALGDGRGLAVTATPGAVPAVTGGSDISGVLVALGAAVLGGLLLNVMPCVFPILSLKALSLARSGGNEAGARREALAYTAGAVVVCAALGGALLGLRAGGASAGWAFQLQNPWVIALLLLLTGAIALNLAGTFELPALGGGDALARQGGAAGAFWTGALAAFVATPCTGPFMGAALGAALVLPTAAAMGVFIGLGLGLAVPFLAIGYIPALRRRLPRPGAWMDRFRRIMSVPMFATALALAWVLGRLAGVDAMALGIAAVLVVALALWWVGLRQGAGRPRAWLPLAGALVLVAGGSALALRPAGPTLATEPFNEARLAALTASGRPVFVYFTADWCVTCKVNEATAIERTEVAQAFARNGTTVLVGDWTRGDAAITRFLAGQGRSGVPLYLYYASRNATPQVLPQVLTPGTLVALGG